MEEWLKVSPWFSRQIVQLRRLIKAAAHEPELVRLGSLGVVAIILVTWALVAVSGYRVVEIAPTSRYVQSTGKDRTWQFATDASPQFTVKTNGRIKARAVEGGFEVTGSGDISASILTTNHAQADLASKIEQAPGKKDQFIVTVQPRTKFQPGHYILHVDVNDGKTTQGYEQDFNWGVLAVNLDKSSYQVGDKVNLGMGVLDDQGHTLCDASVTATIRGPGGSAELSTTNHTVTVSDQCKDKSVTDKPDYSGDFVPRFNGTYQLEVRAQTKNGERLMQDSFAVNSDPDFVVRHHDTATRIYPLANYTVHTQISASRSFGGRIVDRVPASFEITDAKLQINHHNLQSSDSVASFKTEDAGDAKRLIWQGVSLSAGDSVEINYTYKAPDVSPQFYLLGPTTLESDGGQQLFREPRAWQIASDSAGDTIMLWDSASGSVPAGWTCISCVSGDAFFQKFPRATSTYGGTGGSETTTHTFSAPSVSVPSATVSAAAPAILGSTVQVGSATHTHTFGNPTIGALDGTSTHDIRPPFQNLEFIKATNPQTIPQNVIGLFDTSTMPTGWSRVTTITTTLNGGKFLRGEAASGTGGQTTHTHTTTAVTSGSPSATFGAGTTNNVTGTTATHTHTIAAGNTAAANNDPSAVTLVFGQVTTAGSVNIPNGLIAMFDATPPTGWTSISTVGSTYENRLIKGSTTSGTQSGSTTHTHSGALTTGGPSATTPARSSGTNIASSTHTHTVTYTVSSDNAMPNYRDVILGKATTITVAGTVYSDEGSTTLGSQTVKIATGTAITSTTTGAANGTYTTTILDPGTGQDITAYIDSNGGNTGATVTRGNAANISGLDIYQNRLVVRHEDSGPITNANIGSCDKATGTNCTDSDLHFDESSGTLTVDNDWRLYIWGGATFTPGGTVTTSATSTSSSVGGDIKFGSSTSTFSVGTNAVNVGGDWINAAAGTFTKSSGQTTTFKATGSGFTIDQPNARHFDIMTFNGSGGAWSFTQTSDTADSDVTITAGTVTAPSSTWSIGGSYSNSGTFTHNSGTVTFTSTATGKTLAGTMTSTSQFNNLTFNGSGGDWTVNAAVATAGDVTVTAGTLKGTNNITVAGGDTTGAGTINLTGGTFTLNGTGAFGSTGNAWNFNNLTFGSGSAGTTTAQASSGTSNTIAGTMTVSTSQTLNAGSHNWILTNNGTPLSVPGVFTCQTSTVTYQPGGTTGVNVTNVTYHHVAFNKTGNTFSLQSGGLTTDTANSGGNVTITAGTLDTTTNNYAISIGGNYSNSDTFSAHSGTVTFTATGTGHTISGNLTGSNKFNNLTFNGSGGAWSFGANSADVGADMTITLGTVTAPSTTLTISGSYSNAGTLTHNSGSVTFNASTTGKTINSGGTTNGIFNNVTFNNASGGWTLQTNNLKLAGNLTLTALSSWTLASGLTLEVDGTYSVCDSCPSGTTWTGSTLNLNSATNYTVGSKTQSAETYATLQVGANTDIRTWNSSATTNTVNASGSLYGQNYGNVSGQLVIYGDYHTLASATDYWSYDTDFDGASLTGGSKRPATVTIETGSGRGVTVDSTGTLNVKGGGGGSNQYTDINRIGGSGTYQLVNSGTANVREAKITNANFNGGTWTVLNTQVSSQTVTAGTLNIDWYANVHLVDVSNTATNIDTSGATLTVNETSGSPASTVFKEASGAWGSGATSQSFDTGSDGHIPQPDTDGALRLRESSQSSATTTYYQYNVTNAAVGTSYAAFDYHTTAGKYITSTANSSSSEDKSIGSAWYRDTIATENAHSATVNGSPVNGSWYIGASKAVILLWDTANGSVPTGWSCVSCAPGDILYQKFPRAAASAGGTGGSDTGGHDLTSPSASVGAGTQGDTASATSAADTHTHTWNYPTGPNTSTPDIKPPYQDLKFIIGPAIGSWPQNVIAPFRTTTIPTGWTSYSAMTGNYLRGENNNSTGGSTTHTHTANALTSGASVGTVVSRSGSGVSLADAGHTHTIGGDTLTADNNDPSFVTVAFYRHTNTAAVVPDALGFFDYSAVPGNWTTLSNAAPYQNNLLKGATSSLESTGGRATHNHGGSITMTSSGPNSSSNRNNSTTAITGGSSTHTHNVTYTISSASTMPAYRDMVVAKFDQPPDSPTTLVQKKATAGTTLATGDWTNESGSAVTFTAAVSDPDGNNVSLCVEKDTLGTAFSGTEDLCGSAVASGGTASVTISSISDGEYHWQARAQDEFGAYSAWVSYPDTGTNAESARDFGVDTVAPATITVRDTYNTDPSNTTDVSQNGDGSLSQLSASWTTSTDGGSGLAKYQYSVGTSSGGTEVLGWTDSSPSLQLYNTITGLNTAPATAGHLKTGQKYFINIRAVDVAGNAANTSSSDGQSVTPSLSFSVSPNSVTFSNLNNSNKNNPAQVDITLSATTNANGGYVVKARETGPMAWTSYSIPDFQGGTYAAPASWPANTSFCSLGTNCGFGYTSNDTDIGGVNLFASGTKFAPYASAAPGDTVADYLLAVTGSAITNNYTISNRLAAPVNQPAGTYSTTVVFTIVPQY